MLDKQKIINKLKENGDEYHYRNEEICDIGGDLISPTTLEIKHFVIVKKYRRNGLADLLLECIETVARQDNINQINIELGATNCNNLQELQEKKSEENNKWEDPTYIFLKENNFQNLEYVDTYQWGLCVKGCKYILI